MTDADTPALPFQLAAAATEPVALEWNRLSKAAADFNRSIIRAGLVRQLRGAPYTVLGVLLGMLHARESARIFTTTGRLVVWPTRRTICRRTGYKLASVADALAKCRAAGVLAVVEPGGGVSSVGTAYELLAPAPDDDPPAELLPVQPSRRGARAGVDGGRLAEQTGAVRPAGHPPSSRPDAAIGSVSQHGAAADDTSGCAAAAAGSAGDTKNPAAERPELADQLRRAGVAEFVVAELCGMPHVTPELVRRAEREASRHTAEGKRRALLVWMLREPGRVHVPPPAKERRPAAAPVRPAEDPAAAELAARQAAEADQLRELADAGRLAELLAAAVAGVCAADGNPVLCRSWQKYRPDDLPSIARNAPLRGAILQLATGSAACAAELS